MSLKSIFSSLVSKPKLEVCVTFYYRGRDQENNLKDFHRAIFIITEPSNEEPRGTVFQVIHGRPIFEYFTSADTDIRLKQMERYSGRIKIGSVSRGDIGKVERILRGVEVVRDINSSWNCQAWTGEGVQKLVENGLIDAQVPQSLEKELRKAEGEYITNMGL